MARSRDEEEMKKFIQAWKTSKKYAEIKNELEKRKKELSHIMSLDKSALVEHMNNHGLSRDELNAMIQSILEYDSLTPEEKKEFEWINEDIVLIKDKSELYLDFIRTMMTWYTYVYIYQTLEEYEMCAQIKKVIEVEKREFINTLTSYYDFDASDEELLAQIENDVVRRILYGESEQ